MCQNLAILDIIHGLKPGEKAVIEIESLNDSCKDGVKAAITTVCSSKRKGREDYFKIISAARL